MEFVGWQDGPRAGDGCRLIWRLIGETGEAAVGDESGGDGCSRRIQWGGRRGFDGGGGRRWALAEQLGEGRSDQLKDNKSTIRKPELVAGRITAATPNVAVAWRG